MVDLDESKTVNDTHDHATGDDVLKLVAALIRQRTTQPGAIVAHYRGEEFVAASRR